MCEKVPYTFLQRRHRSDQYTHKKSGQHQSLSISDKETRSKGDVAFQNDFYKNKITYVGKNVEKWNICTLLTGMENGIAIMEQSRNPSKKLLREFS